MPKPPPGAGNAPPRPHVPSLHASAPDFPAPRPVRRDGARRFRSRASDDRRCGLKQVRPRSPRRCRAARTLLRPALPCKTLRKTGFAGAPVPLRSLRTGGRTCGQGGAFPPRECLIPRCRRTRCRGPAFRQAPHRRRCSVSERISARPDPGLASSAAPTRAPHSAGSICGPLHSAPPIPVSPLPPHRREPRTLREAAANLFIPRLRSQSRFFRRTDASPALCGKRLRTFSFRVPDPGLAFSAAPTRAPHSAGSICEPPPSARLRSSRFRTIYSQPPFPPPDGIVSAPVRPRGISPPDCRAGGGYSPRSSAAFDPPGFRAFRQNAEKRLLPPASPRRSTPPRVSPPGEMQKKVAFAPDLFVPLPLG